MEVDINSYLLMVIYASLIFNIGITLYGIFFKPHLTKKIIAVSIFSDTANIIAIFIGYRRWPSLHEPTLLAHLEELVNYREALEELVIRSVDPLPQVLVITAIVIGLAVQLYLVSLAINLYRAYNTLDSREIRRLKG